MPISVKPRQVEVRWLDAHHDHSSDFKFADEIPKDNPMMILANTGYYVGSHLEVTYIASSLSLSSDERPGQWMFRDIMAIPTKNIISMETIGRKVTYGTRRGHKGHHGKK
jgi:hypothetical protein